MNYVRGDCATCIDDQGCPSGRVTLTHEYGVLDFRDDPMMGPEIRIVCDDKVVRWAPAYRFVKTFHVQSVGQGYSNGGLVGTGGGGGPGVGVAGTAGNSPTQGTVKKMSLTEWAAQTGYSPNNLLGQEVHKAIVDEITEPINPKCDCGGAFVGGHHSSWCSTQGGKS